MVNSQWSVGVDLVEISKVRRVFEERKALQESVFTREELRYSMRQRVPFVQLATFFALKEAFFKALGTGLSGEMNWRDVETVRESGDKSALRLRGKAAEVAQSQGVTDSFVSLTRTEKYAAGLVVLVIDK